MPALTTLPIITDEVGNRLAARAMIAVDPTGAYVPGATLRIVAPGAYVAFDATSKTVAIPNTLTGAAPLRARLCATAAAYVRLGLADEASAVAASAGAGYAVDDTITLAGGVFTSAMELTIASTKVVSATVDDAGTGGTPGSATVTGTTGTGTPFQATVTIDITGVITSVDSISVAGAYTADPADIAHEPVTGGSLTGAALAIVLGVKTVTVTDPGSYVVDPANPVSQGSTSGGGTGATFTLSFIAAASAGDMIIQPGDSVILDVVGYDQVAVIQVTAGGVLQLSPIEN